MEDFALRFTKELWQWQKLSFRDFSGPQEWLGLKDRASKHRDYPIKSIIFLVLNSASSVNQELCWVIQHLNYNLVTSMDLKDSSGLLWPQSSHVVDRCSNSPTSFSPCYSIVQGSVCNAQEDVVVIRTILNEGRLVQIVTWQTALVRAAQSQGTLHHGSSLLLAARRCFGIRILHCCSLPLPSKHRNQATELWMWGYVRKAASNLTNNSLAFDLEAGNGPFSS